MNNGILKAKARQLRENTIEFHHFKKMRLSNAMFSDLLC